MVRPGSLVRVLLVVTLIASGVTYALPSPSRIVVELPTNGWVVIVRSSSREGVEVSGRFAKAGSAVPMTMTESAKTMDIPLPRAACLRMPVNKDVPPWPSCIYRAPRADIMRSTQIAYVMCSFPVPPPPEEPCAAPVRPGNRTDRVPRLR